MNNSAERLFEAYKEDFGTSRPESIPAIGDKIADVIPLSSPVNETLATKPDKPADVVLLEAYNEQMGVPERREVITKSGRKVIEASNKSRPLTQANYGVIKANLSGIMPKKAKVPKVKAPETPEPVAVKEEEQPKHARTTVGELLAELNQSEENKQQGLIDDFSVPEPVEPVQFPKEIKLIDNEKNSNVSEFSMTWNDGTVNETENAPKNVKTNLDGLEKMANEQGKDTAADEESEGVESTGGEDEPGEEPAQEVASEAPIGDSEGNSDEEPKEPTSEPDPVLKDLSGGGADMENFDKVQEGRSLGGMVKKSNEKSIEIDDNDKIKKIVPGRNKQPWQENMLVAWVKHTKNKLRAELEARKVGWRNRRKGYGRRRR